MNSIEEDSFFPPAALTEEEKARLALKRAQSAEKLLETIDRFGAGEFDEGGLRPGEVKVNWGNSWISWDSLVDLVAAGLVEVRTEVEQVEIDHQFVRRVKREPEAFA